MAEKDSITKKYFSNKERFAELFNVFLFNGHNVINPNSLTVLDTTETGIDYKNADNAVLQDSLIVQKYRDVLKCVTITKDDKSYYIVLGIENQTKIDTSMVVRCMLYDSLQYFAQLDSKNKTAKIKLKPVITLVVYWGGDIWTGPKSLYEMLDIDSYNVIDNNLSKFVSDYKLNVLEFSKLIGNLDSLTKTDLGLVLEYLKIYYSCKRNKTDLSVILRGNPLLSRLNVESADILDRFTGSKYREFIQNTGGCNMIEPWDCIGTDKYKEGKADGLAEGKAKGLAEGKAEGLAEGKAEGRADGILTMVRNFIKAGVSDDIVLKASGMSVEELATIKKELQDSKSTDDSFNPSDLF